MIVCATLNGWSSSSRGKGNRLSTIVENDLRGREHVLLSRRALIGMSRTWMFRRFILRHESADNTLLLCAKSLGGRNMVKGVLNKLPELVYKRTALLTVDINWPTWSDWTPNLNRRTLHLEHKIDRTINLFVNGEPRQQAGCQLAGPYPVRNIGLLGYDHGSIVIAPEVRITLRALIEYLEE